MPGTSFFLATGLLFQAHGWVVLEGDFAITNPSDTPICVSASVLDSSLTAGQFDLLSSEGEITEIHRTPVVTVADPPLPPNWLVIPPNGEIQVKRSLLTTGREAQGHTPVSARIPYFTLPCDFVMGSYVHRNPSADSEQDRAIDAEADRLVEYRTTDWAPVTVANPGD